MLQLKNIEKIYLEHSENEVRALKGVTLNFRECEFVSILGQSGCGKTTLLNLIGGLDRASKGEIIIDGVSTTNYTSSDWDSYRNEKIGFVFQNYNLIPHLNILTNVELALTISGVSASERTRRAKKALDDVGLSSQYNKLPNQISGGQAQRVAIARAIVNNPAILLADEPTGAIDSETSKQIMDLLGQISTQRLVIMVTHNIELAERYSTRIIRVLDGKVIEDTNPFDPDEAKRLAEEKIVGDPLVYAAKHTVDVLDLADKAQNAAKSDPNASDEKADGANDTAPKKRAAMPFFTAVKLSLRNMINKFARSLITAVAGSIGIICIALILAVNNGFSNYIAAFEKQSMYKYPITASVSNETGMSAFYAFLAASAAGLDEIDISSIFDIVDDGSSDAGRYTEEDMIHVFSQMGAMMNNFIKNQNVTKDISRFKRHVDSTFDTTLASVRYDYDITMNIYAKGEESGQVKYTQISPISESMFISSILEMVGAGGGADSESSAMLNQIKGLLEQFAFWDELVDNDEVITSQYDILAGHLPANKNEAVLVVNDYNQISDFYALALNELGLTDFIASVIDSKKLEELDRKFDEVIDSEHFTYYVLPTSAAFVHDKLTGKFINIKAPSTMGASPLSAAIESSAIPVHISGIIRAKEGVTGCINGVMAYSHELSTYIIDDANNSDYVKAQQQKYLEYLDTVNYYYEMSDYLAANDPDGKTLSAEERTKFQQAGFVALGGIIEDVTGKIFTEDAYANALYMANMRDMDVPQRIYFYANNVDYKDDITRFIADFNASEEAKDEKYTMRGKDMVRSFTVEYSDDLDATVTELHNTVTMITYILIGIALVSVVVTMFLIAIIMSISVQDRTREIGILRSLGARKVDIANIFNAETAFLGLFAGAFGVLLAYALQYPGNLLCESLLGIGGVLQLAWWHPIVLIIGSILLTVIAGFIPAISAAKKDPVIALRSE